MAGWRVGFALGNAPALAALARLKSYLDYGTFQPIQIASIVALNEERDYPAEACEIYRKRRNVLCDGLARIGWHVERPLGTMFVWAPIPEPYRELGSLEFAVKLTREAHVAVSPGVGFGPGGEGFVRFALVENEQRIAQAVRGIRRALPELARGRDALDRRGFAVAARDAVALGRIGDGGGDDADDLAVEDARDDVLRPELVGADHAGDRVTGRELHSFGDVAGAHVQRAAEDAGEREHVVDLVRVVRPAGRDRRPRALRAPRVRPPASDWPSRRRSRPSPSSGSPSTRDRSRLRQPDVHVRTREHVVRGPALPVRVGLVRVVGLDSFQARTTGVDGALPVTTDDRARPRRAGGSVSPRRRRRRPR